MSWRFGLYFPSKLSFTSFPSWTEMTLSAVTVSIKLITGEYPESLLQWHHKKSPYSLVFNLVSELFLLINVKDWENNLVRTALLKTYNSLNNTSCKYKLGSYTMSPVWIISDNFQHDVVTGIQILVYVMLKSHLRKLHYNSFHPFHLDCVSQLL